MSQQEVIYTAEISSFSECHVAGIVFIFFTTVVKMPSIVLGSTVGPTYVLVEWKQRCACSRKPAVCTESILWTELWITFLFQVKGGRPWPSGYLCFYYFRFKTSIVLWSKWITLTFYHILSDSSLFKMLLVLLLNKLEQAINSTGLQRLGLGSQYQNDFDYWVGIYP